MAENIRDIFLEREKTTLSEFAFLTSNTKGREHPYTPCDNRTEFQRDRDKIIHSKSFKNLVVIFEITLTVSSAEEILHISESDFVGHRNSSRNTNALCILLGKLNEIHGIGYD